jgi:hypothetical protein
VKAIVWPTLTYGYEAFYRPDTVAKCPAYLVDMIDMELRRALRTALPAWKTTPLPILHAESGVLPAKWMIKWRSEKFAERARQLPPGHLAKGHAAPPETEGPDPASQVELGNEYLRQSNHPSQKGQEWLEKPPALWMNRKNAHKWVAYRSGHGDFLRYHTRFGHQTEGLKNCMCGSTKEQHEVESCGLFKEQWRLKDRKKAKDFVRRVEGQEERALVVRTVAEALDWKVTFYWGPQRAPSTESEEEEMEVVEPMAAVPPTPTETP